MVLAFAGCTAPSWASSITLQPATVVQATVGNCATSPCQTNVTQSSSVTGVLLSNFGDSYVTSSFTPGLNGITLDTPGSMTANGNATLSISGFPFPSMSGSLTYSQGSINGGAAEQAELTYYFAVIPNNGNTSQTPVQIQVNSLGSIIESTSGDLNASNVNITLQIPGVLDDEAQAAYSYACTPSDCPPTIVNSSLTEGNGFVSTPGVNGAVIGQTSSMSGGINESGIYTVNTNTTYEVIMQMNAQGGADGGGSASWYLDPTITVPGTDTLQLSSGVGNSSSVPEPATWTLLACGIGLICAAKRNK
jgi:PEP-CTERM motif-containing protein